MFGARNSPVNRETHRQDILDIVHPAALKEVEKRRSPSRLENASNNQAFDTRKLPKTPADGSASSLRNEKTWVAKRVPTILIACCEVLGQEGIRLFSPVHQHKTRFSILEDKIGVLSEKIMSFESMTEKAVLNAMEEKQGSGKIPGLGVIAVLSLFFNETDLKLEHLDANTCEKIDGDWFFSLLSKKEQFLAGSDITEPDIENLPYLINMKVNQWLDQGEAGKLKKISKDLIFFNMAQDPRFRLEVNQTIFKLLTLPDKVYKDFVASYVQSAEVQKLFADTILKRKTQLKTAALKNASFRNFLTDTEEPQLCVEAQQSHLRAFTTTEKRRLVADKDYPRLKADLAEAARLLKSEGKQPIKETPLLKENFSTNKQQQQSAGSAFKKVGKK